MLKARKKLAALAVASAISGGALMVSAPVQALNVSQNNLGEVLLFPYYTVKSGFDTIFTVTNTSTQTAAFKVRFREALNSREVRDFNVVLSPYDHWSGAVTKNGTDGAAVRTFDKTCTSPDKPAWTPVDLNGDGTTDGYEVPFSKQLFTGIYNDGATEDMSRVQEGYFEVILMGVSSREYTNSANTVEWGAKHKSDGVPNDCAAVDKAFTTINTSFSAFTAGDSILKGHVTYIDTATGKSVDAEPTAIEGFKSGAHIVKPPSNELPNLASGDPDLEVNVLVNGVAIPSATTGTSELAVTKALMANMLINEFATGSGAATSWVVTFPTKHHFTDYYDSTGTSTSAPSAFAPFSYRFVGDTDGTGKSCDKISMGMFNREEKTEVKVDGTDFSPAPPAGSPVSLCYEANVIDFNGTKVFGDGTNRLGISTSKVGSAGWAALQFIGGNVNQALGGFTGLPAIGFAAIVRDAGSASVNYGSNTVHSIVSGAPAQNP